MKIPISREPLALYKGATVDYHPDGEKMNPNSIRFLFGAIIKFCFQGRQNKAIQVMAKNSSRFVSERNPGKRKEMNDEAMQGVLKDRDFIEYWHIEAFSHAVDLPSGAMLCLSHLISLIRDGDTRRADAFAEGLSQFAELMKAQAKSADLDYDMLKQMAACFDGLRVASNNNAQSDGSNN